MGRPRILKKKKVGKMKIKHAKQAANRKATKIRKDDRVKIPSVDDHTDSDDSPSEE